MLYWPRNCAHSGFSSLVHSLLPRDNLFKNIFDFTTAGECMCGSRGGGIEVADPPPLKNHVIWVSIEISIWTPPPPLEKVGTPVNVGPPPPVKL